MKKTRTTTTKSTQSFIPFESTRFSKYNYPDRTGSKVRIVRRMLAAMQRNIRRSVRVMDEGAIGGITTNDEVIGGDGQRSPPPQGWLVRGGLSVMYRVIRAPMSLLSCITRPHIVNRADRVWVSRRDFVNASEINHLVVDDSIRYAMFM